MSQTTSLVIPLCGCVFLLGAVGAGVAADEKPTPALVRGKVTSVGKPKGVETKATVSVERVYTGPQKLLKATFEDTYTPLEFVFHDGPATTPFEVEEEGLWVVWLNGDRLSVGQRPKDLGWPIWNRYRRKETTAEAFEVIEGVAEGIEKVEAALPERRLPMLRKYAESDQAVKVAWALTAVGNLDGADAGQFLDELSQKDFDTFPVSTQIVLDVVLTRRTPSTWTDSKRRAAMLRGWVKEKRTEREGGAILSRIYSAHQDQALSDKLAVELTSAAAANLNWPADVRREGFSQVSHAALRSVNEEARTTAFDWMLGQMKTNEDIKLRRALAEFVLHEFPLYPKRILAIEEHISTEKDPEIIKTLREAIKKAKEPEKK